MVEWCKSCKDRGRLSIASRQVDGTPMCEDCFRGREAQGVPIALAQLRLASVEQPQGAQIREGKPMTKQIDWNKVQEERDTGATVTALAEKYSCSDVTICNHTKPGRAVRRNKPGRLEAIAERGSRRPSKNGSGRSGAGFADVLADLRERRAALDTERDALDEAIAALEKVG